MRMARADGGWRDPGCWHAPLILTSAALAMLTAAGVLPVLAGAVLAVVPLAVVAMVVRAAWRSAAGKLGRGTATRIVLRGLAGRLKDALWNVKEDMHGLTGRARPAPAAVPVTAPRGLALTPDAVERLRAVPPLTQTAGPGGDVPYPAWRSPRNWRAFSGASVPREWQALADHIADFEPQDQDEHDEHMSGEAAGLLTIAEAAMARAETLMGARKLHPRYVAGLLEVADGFADLASFSALAHRRYHEEYEAVEEYHEAGGELPEDARGWFGGAA